jgi:hypothetical protein
METRPAISKLGNPVFKLGCTRVILFYLWHFPYDRIGVSKSDRGVATRSVFTLVKLLAHLYGDINVLVTVHYNRT